MYGIKSKPVFSFTGIYKVHTWCTSSLCGFTDTVASERYSKLTYRSKIEERATMRMHKPDIQSETSQGSTSSPHHRRVGGSEKISLSQKDHFFVEIKLLKSNATIPESSSLFKLHPLLGSDGLVWFGLVAE